MLASQNLLQMCSNQFDATKSTKGASKLRRDLINSEIANLRDLLPLPSSTRQRLSQLQLMALVCVYVRKANYFQNTFHKHSFMSQLPLTNFGFSKALSGFLMMMTQNGKLLYISDNAAEYLGHSMEDLLIHGDSVYDIIEKQDHQNIQNQLMRTPSSDPAGAYESRIFLCRMNVSRNSRRQMRFGDQKVVLVQGHYFKYLPFSSRNEDVFLATCTPVAMPETRECVVQGATNVFTSIHSMDMKFLHLDSNGEHYLGYTKSQMKNMSWYDIVHWDNLTEAQSKHRLITQSEQERSCILLLRLQTLTFQWVWVHVVLQVKENNENSQQPVIVCTNQVLSEKEATVMQANSWLYQFYSLHSKMHYMQQQQQQQSQNGAHSGANTCTSAPNSSPPTPGNNTSTTDQYDTISVSSNPSVVSRSFSQSHHSSSTYQVPTAGQEAPSLANMQNYYGNASGNVSINTGHYHGAHFTQANGIQQYSPQAGTLPYQSNTITTPNTPPAAATQTESIRVKEEMIETPTPRTKRSRAQNDNNEHKKSKSKKSCQENSVSHTTMTNSSDSHQQSYGHYGHAHHQHHHSSAAAAAAGYGAYHPAGSMFNTGTFTSDLSSMMPAYYGGSISYHSQLAHYHHPHHFQSKFPFFEQASNNASNISSSAASATTDPYPQHSNVPRNCQTSETALVTSSSAFGQNFPTVVKSSKLYSPEMSSFIDRREKVRSPESATSDYGSMTSQSPPSNLKNASESMETQYARAHYHSHPHHQMSFQFWSSGYSVANSASTEQEAAAVAAAVQHHQQRHLPMTSTFPVDSLIHAGQTAASVYAHSFGTNAYDGQDLVTGQQTSQANVQRSKSVSNDVKQAVNSKSS